MITMKIRLHNNSHIFQHYEKCICMGMQLVTETAASASWSAGFFTARYDPPSSIRPIHSHNLPNIFFIFFFIIYFRISPLCTWHSNCNCNDYNIFSRFVVQISAQVAPWCGRSNAWDGMRSWLPIAAWFHRSMVIMMMVVARSLHLRIGGSVDRRRRATNAHFMQISAARSPCVGFAYGSLSRFTSASKCNLECLNLLTVNRRR